MLGTGAACTFTERQNSRQALPWLFQLPCVLAASGSASLRWGAPAGPRRPSCQAPAPQESAQALAAEPEGPAVPTRLPPVRQERQEKVLPSRCSACPANA